MHHTCSAAAADVVLLNEIGLDPGIDHLSAMSLIDRLKAQGKHVTHFTSFCGGLPAPEAAIGVPLGYKFSWSPRGVLVAALNAARFKVEGKVSPDESCIVLAIVLAFRRADGRGVTPQGCRGAR